MADTTLVLSSLTADVDEFVQQFQTYLQNNPTWVGNLTTQTSETLIELISSIGAFAQARIIREYEDSFSETAQSDDAILSATQMQGLRIARYLPAGVTGTLNSPVSVTLPPLTQFTSSGAYFFNRDQVTILAGTPLDVTLFEGQIFSYSMNGLGTDRQTFVSSEGNFTVSDQDVLVQINGSLIPKAYGNLWNFDGLPGYVDLTMSDGRVLLQFGNSGGVNQQFGTLRQFGTIPQINDQVIISYPVTQGANGNNLTTLNKTVSVSGFPQINGTLTANPTGGANDKPIVAYKNNGAGGFGNYQSAVTKSQYTATIGVFPGIIDAVTQAQREINPRALQWMNIIRVSGLTTSPWTQAQKKAFTDYCQTVTMYSTYFLWQDPIPVPRAVTLNIFIFNSGIPTQVQQASVTAIQNLFAPRPGLLMTNFYVSDLIETCVNANPQQISYIIPGDDTGTMIVTAPDSPVPTFTLIAGGGTLGSLVYSYGIATTVMLPDGTVETGTPANWVFPQVISTTSNFGIKLTWPAVFGAISYQIYGRNAGQGIGLLATVLSTSPLEFVDDGSITPTGDAPNGIADVPIRYNSLASLVINVQYSERQQKTGSGDPVRLANN